VLTAKQTGPGLLGCYVMSSSTSQHGCQHGVTYQKTHIFFSTTVRTSDLKYQLPVHKCIFASVITFYYGIISHVTELQLPARYLQPGYITSNQWK